MPRKPYVNIGLPRGATVEQRFAHYYSIAANGCWLWRGHLSADGYAEFTVAGKRWGAHRWSYTQKHGPIPPGLMLDHFVCDTPSCVNPDHVRENILRSPKTVPTLNLLKRECNRGHPFPGDWAGESHCAECRRLNGRARRARGFVPSGSLRGGLAALLASRESS